MRITIFCDGACEPCNPGGYGCCAFVAFEGDVSGAAGAPRPEPLHAQYGFIGSGPGMTNNITEYRAVRGALRWVAKYHANDKVEIRTDSQLVVKQVAGSWACKAEHLQPFRQECRDILRGLSDTRLIWIPRELNDVADALTRVAYREARAAA